MTSCQNLEVARMNNDLITHSGHCLGRPLSQKGFTLIEMAFVLVIVGILVGLGAQVLPMLVKQNKLKDDRMFVKEVRTAIIGYALATGRLPFASANINGSETTNRLNGYLPWATLGINGKDPYQTTLFYSVESHLTTTTPATLKTTIGQLINGTPAPDLFCDNGNLKVAFVVLSAGENRRADSPNDDTGEGLITNSDNNQFASPSALISSNYNDILETASLTYLYGLLP
jgi:prepilin-type N-terminal cleavage/methylation domain-containing protein